MSKEEWMEQEIVRLTDELNKANERIAELHHLLIALGRGPAHPDFAKLFYNPPDEENENEN